VIEPTSSEEEEFVRSIREMNATWAPMSKSRAKMKANNHRLSLGHQGEEMSMMTHPLGAHSSSSSAHLNASNSGSGGLFQRIARWKRRSGRKAPAGKEAGDDEDEDEEEGDLELLQRAEEHVLPDSFEDVDLNNEEEFKRHKSSYNRENSTNIKSPYDNEELIDHKRQLKVTTINVGSADRLQRPSSRVEESGSARESLSPRSRKSIFGSKTKMATPGEATSVATSDDSGIVLGQIPPKILVSSYNKAENETQLESMAAATAAADLHSRLGRIEEVSVASSASRSSSQTLLAQQQQQQQQQQPLRPRKERPDPPVRPQRRRSPGRPAVPPIISTTAAVSLGLSRLSPAGLLRRKSLEAKAWYDVPSDDDIGSGRQSSNGGGGGEGVPEDDSLASIISTKGGSTDEEGGTLEEDFGGEF